MEDHQEEKIRTNKGLVRVYFTLFSIGLATIILSIISSEHKESIALFNQYSEDSATHLLNTAAATTTETTFDEGTGIG